MTPEEALDIGENALHSLAFHDFQGEGILVLTNKDRIVSIEKEDNQWRIIQTIPLQQLRNVMVEEHWRSNSLTLIYELGCDDRETLTFQNIPKDHLREWVANLRETKSNSDNARIAVQAIIERINSQPTTTFDEIDQIFKNYNVNSTADSLVSMIAKGWIEGVMDRNQRIFTQRRYERKEDVTYQVQVVVGMEGVVKLLCKSCGAPLQTKSGKAICPFCKTESLLSSKILNML